MTRTIITLLSTVALFTLTFASVASAQGNGDHPCRADAERLCGDASSRQERHACMESHQDALSASCKDAIAERKDKREQHRAAFEGACGADAAQFCAGIEPGRELASCMKAHRDDLSETCHEALQSFRDQKGLRGKRHGDRGERGKGQRAAVKAACSGDAQRLCADAEPGRGMMACMKEHRAELSATCSAAVDEARAGRKGNRKGKKGQGKGKKAAKQG